MRLVSTRAVLGAATLLGAAALVAAKPAIPRAPHLGIASFDQLAKPLPLPYDEAANGDAAIKAAGERARRGGKLLLIDLGGNWCLDCRILAGTMETAPLKPWLARHYEIVTVDVGRFDRNMGVPARYGATGRLAGVPAVLIVDPRTNRLVNPGDIAALADARTMTPQGLADWLARWAR